MTRAYEREATWLASAIVIAIAGLATVRAAPHEPSPAPAHEHESAAAPDGKDVYTAACATCHGADGRGARRDVVGFERALPDFSDCAFTTAEPDPDWFAVVHEGGPVRGLGRQMPAFGDALSAEEITAAVRHVRAFCIDARWPRGDLNLPRPLFLEKAFPENEVVVTTAAAAEGPSAATTTVLYEKRLGARSQIEALIPFGSQPGPSGGRVRGIGDVAVGVKHAVVASMHAGTILSAGAEVVFPTGDEAEGLGSGVTVFEPAVMAGQLLPHNSFVHAHGGIELPSDSHKADREAFVRTAVGTTFAANHGFGRTWTPQLEALWARPFHGASEWDLVPQLQVSLSKLQHVLVAGGMRIPVTERSERHPQVVMYVLWDFFDGGLFDYWR